METLPSNIRGYSFESFQLDLRANELRKGGMKVKLQDQPFAVLVLLLEAKGDLVTREEVCKRLWPEDTFVDFEKSVNTAIFNLREALGDEAASPRYIQTVPKKGYRFIPLVEEVRDSVAPTAVTTVTAEHDDSGKSKKGDLDNPVSRYWAAVAGIAVMLAVAVWILMQLWPSRVRIAVLMFQNLSGDEKEEYFTRGQTDELITQLGRVNPRDLGVIGFATISAYPKTDAIQAGRDLHVQYVVEGSASRNGNRVHINVRMLETKEGTSVWVNQYDRDYSPSTPEEVAKDIAQSIQVQLQPQPKIGPPNQNAYDAALRGRYFMNRRGDDDLRKSQAFLQQAVAIDPNYALGHAYLADFYNLIGFYSIARPTEAYSMAKAEAKRALELDPNLAAAHASLADVTYIHEWNWQGAQNEFKRATILNPNYAPAHQWYGMFLASRGDFDAGLEEMQKALEIEPLSLVINADLGLSLYYARRFDQALTQYQKTIDLDRNVSFPHTWAGMTLIKMKRYDEAIAQLEKAVELSNGSQGTVGLLAYGYGMAGQKDKARATLEKLLDLQTHTPYVSPAYIAVAYIGLGQPDKVFEWADKCVEQRAALLARIKVEPVVDPVRDDPRFAKLLERVNVR